MLLDREDSHYLAISAFYGDKCARRSGVRYMNHIDEGLRVLDAIDASLDAQRAYCLHPIVQADADLARAFASGSPLLPCPARTIAIAIEYRCFANAYLSTRDIKGELEAIQLSTRPEVNKMLIADKVQNRKDFCAHHAATHPRSAALQTYFDNWLTRLGVSEELLWELTTVCDG